MQSKANASIAVGHQHNHDGGVFRALASIYKDYGFTGLWRGVTGACVRLAMGSCSQITVFYVIREYLEEYKVNDNLPVYQVVIIFLNDFVQSLFTSLGLML